MAEDHFGWKLLRPEEHDALIKDAERYRWLRDHYDGVDFDYCDGLSALIFDWPKEGRVSGNLDRTIDDQMQRERLPHSREGDR